MQVKMNDGSSPALEVIIVPMDNKNSKPLAQTSLSGGSADTGSAGFSKFVWDVGSQMGYELWSPESPTLYSMTVKANGKDVISSYIGFRTISRGEINGVQRPLLNGKFIFHFGTLDQGFWPDGIYSPPSVEAMRYDLEILKKIGYNMVRKHVSLTFLIFAKTVLTRLCRSKSNPHCGTRHVTSSVFLSSRICHL